MYIDGGVLRSCEPKNKLSPHIAGLFKEDHMEEKNWKRRLKGNCMEKRWMAWLQQYPGDQRLASLFSSHATAFWPSAWGPDPPTLADSSNIP